MKELEKKSLNDTIKVFLMVLISIVIFSFNKEMTELALFLWSRIDVFFKILTYHLFALISFIIVSNMFLTIIGRNLSTWNEGSYAKKILKNKYESVMFVRIAFTLLVILFSFLNTYVDFFQNHKMEYGKFSL